MSTSGSIDFNMTAQAIVTFAVRKINARDALDPVTAEEMRDGLEALNMMLKGWQVEAPNLFRQTFGSKALVADTASYVITPRPFRIVEMRYRNASGTDLPMEELTRQEYVDLPSKASTGTPTSYYVDYQRATVTVYVWPVPASVTTETLQFTYQRAFEDVDAQADDIDIPQEWFETVAYNLAARLAETFRMQNGDVNKRAAYLLAMAKDSDREDVVRFVPGGY